MKEINTYIMFICRICFLLLIIGSGSTVTAQVKVKGKLDQLVDTKNKKEQQAVQEEKQFQDSVAQVAKDSVIQAERAQAVEDSIQKAQVLAEFMSKFEIDTNDFAKRIATVKQRHPNSKGSVQHWNRKYLISTANAYKKIHQLDSNYKVFGWHPYWMGTSYESYNYTLLSHIAYFSYELNPSTGGYRTVHDWKTTPMIDSAKKYNCKVLLSVTNFGTENNRLFLKNVAAQKKFIKEITALLRARNGDGVNIDFEKVPQDQRRAFTNFIINLSTSLKTINKDFEVTLAIPAIDFKGIIDFAQLDKYVDLFVVMGYEFYGANNKVAGPVAPLRSGQTWWKFNLERAIDDYLIAGVTPKKILLGLPYYGAEWRTKDLIVPAEAEQFVRYPMYRTIRKEYASETRKIDLESQSAFLAFEEGTSFKYRQVWFEDSTTLGAKYDWVKERQIGGIGIWALGFDNGYDDLWILLANRFSVPEGMVQQATTKKIRRGFWRRIMFLALRAMRNPMSLLRSPRPLMMIFGGLFGVSMIGFFILFRFGCRFKRFFNLFLKSSLTLLVLILIVLVFIAMRYTGLREAAFLFGGLILGGIIIFIYSRRFISEKDLP